VLPAGLINPDLLRVEPKALSFIKDILLKEDCRRCHAPWLLIETGLSKRRRAFACTRGIPAEKGALTGFGAAGVLTRADSG
jgi:hypothetical protein